MPGSPEPPAPFEVAVVDAVAADHGLAPATLVDLLARHHGLLAGFGDLTVSDLVREWRTSFSPDPLVSRDGDVYYLAPPEHAWSDLVARLDLDDREAEALRAAHERQFAADRGEAPEGALLLAAE